MIQYLEKVAAGRWKKLSKFQQHELQIRGLVYLDEYDSPRFTEAGRDMLSDRPRNRGTVHGSGQG